MHRAVVVPVLRDRHAAGRGPLVDLIKLLLLRLGGIVVVVHAPGDVLADAVETQPVVAEAHRQHLRYGLVVLELPAATLRKQAVYDPHAERAVLPELEQRLIACSRQVEAAGIAHAGNPQAVELAEELPRALDTLVECRQRQLVKQAADGGIVSEDPAGRRAVGGALDLAARRHVRVAGDVECLIASGREQGRAVEQLDVDRIVGRGREQLDLGRPPLFHELLLGPTAGDDDPLAGLRPLGRGLYARHRFGD